MNKDKLLLERLIAYGIDWYFISMITNLINAVFYTIHTGKFAIVALGTKMPVLLQLSSFAVSIVGAILYCYFFTWIKPEYYGQTIGKKLTHIRLVNSDGEKASLTAVAKRIAIGFVLVEGALLPPSFIFRAILANFLNNTLISVVLIISTVISAVSIFLMIKKDDSRMLHDYIAGTKIIHE